MNNKEIIVGVDFSECSINALEHAITIANKSNSDILMVWVNKPDNTKAIFLIDPDKIKDVVKKQFEKLIDKYQPELENTKLSYIIREGKVYKEIVNQANENKSFLIVVGTHGSSGFEEFWIGSDANRIVNAAVCPVITIRLSIDVHKSLKKIVLPIDKTLDTRQKVPFTALLAKYFDAEIYILSLYNTHVKSIRDIIDSYAAQVAKYLDEKEVNYRLDSIEANNITDSTIEYAKKIDANLISIMDEQERTTANILLGSYAQQMINHSPIPVLCIHAKELMRLGTR